MTFLARLSKFDVINVGDHRAVKGSHKNGK